MSLARRRGLIAIDVMFGLSILALLITILTVSTTQNRRAMRGLAQHRAALRTAERVMLEMRANRPVGPVDESMELAIEPAAAPAGASWRWVTVTVRCDRQHARLEGLVPAAATTESAP